MPKKDSFINLKCTPKPFFPKGYSSLEERGYSLSYIGSVLSLIGSVHISYFEIGISQSGFQATSTTLSVSNKNLSFSSLGGNEQITVTTNARSYTVSDLPSWCSVQGYTGYFVITCNANTRSSQRTGYLTVAAGDKTERIAISQSGYVAARSSNNNRSNNRNKSVYKPNRCFNCPGYHYSGGLSVGYVRQFLATNWDAIPLEGLQIGVRYNPLFNYGFGFNTGVFYEYYFSSYVNFYDNQYNDFKKMALNIPLHLEYRLNFSPSFSLFFFGGGSVDFELKYDPNDIYSEYSYIDYMFYWDAGGGVRINRVQFNVGVNMGESQRKTYISLSYILPWN